jgi:hypothetical protein
MCCRTSFIMNECWYIGYIFRDVEFFCLWDICDVLQFFNQNNIIVMYQCFVLYKKKYLDWKDIFVQRANDFI